MTIYTHSQIAIKIGKLAELYKEGQVSEITAQTISKLIDYEINQAKSNLEATEKDLAVYEKRFGISTKRFFKKYQAGKTDDSSESVEWASLAQMAERIKQRLEFLMGENSK